MTRSAHQWSPHAFCQFSGPQYVRRHVQGLSGTRHRVRPLRHHADRQGCKELFALCPPSSNLIMYFFLKLIREKVFKNRCEKWARNFQQLPVHLPHFGLLLRIFRLRVRGLLQKRLEVQNANLAKRLRSKFRQNGYLLYIVCIVTYTVDCVLLNKYCIKRAKAFLNLDIHTLYL